MKFLNIPWLINGLVFECFGDVRRALGLWNERPWIVQSIREGPWMNMRAALPDEIEKYDKLFLEDLRIGGHDARSGL